MAMQVSIDRDHSERPSAGPTATSRAASRLGSGFASGFASWAVTAVDHLGRLLAFAFERVQSVRSRGAKRSKMQVIESLALGNRRQLLLVVCGDQRYLVGAGAVCVGSILALEPGLVRAKETGNPAELSSRLMDGAAKGPELVRQRGRLFSSESKPGRETGPRTDAWQ